MLSGIVVGRPGGELPETEFDNYDRVLLQVVREELGLSDLPILTRMDFGHTDPMFVVPYGVHAEIRCDDSGFAITESAVL